MEMHMSTIDPNAKFETLDFDEIDAAIVRGRRLQAQFMASALKALFSRRAKTPQKQDGHMPDCTAAA